MTKKNVSLNAYKDNVLKAFLDECRPPCRPKNSDEKQKFTHTSIDRPKGIYNIEEDSMNTFWDLYYQVTFKDKIPVHLTERVSDMEFTPFKIDIDFRYYAKDTNRLYTNDDIEDICKLYMKYMNEWFQPLEIDDREFFILEKSKPVYDLDRAGKKKLKEGTTDMFRIKDGIHIITPYIVHKAVVQHEVRKKVFQNVGSILDKYDLDSKYHEIFDEAVIQKNNWQLYGSTKPFKEPYKVTKILRVWEDRIENVELSKYSDRELVELLSMRNKDDEAYTSILHGHVEERVYILDEEYSNKKGGRLISRRKKLKNIRKLKKDDIKLVCNYVDCLNPERANPYNSWIEVGWCLHNLHNKDDTYSKNG